MVAKIFKAVAEVLADIASFWLFGIMLLVVVDVSMRYLLSNPIPGTLEISEQTVVLLVFMCFAFTGMQERHIRTTAILDHLPRWMNTVSTFLGTLLMLILLTVLVWQTSKEAWLAFSIRELRMGLVMVPIYPAKIAIPVGLFIAWLFYFAKLFGLADNLMIKSDPEE